MDKLSDIFIATCYYLKHDSMIKTVKKVMNMIIIILVTMIISSGTVAAASSLGVFYYPWSGGQSENWKHWADHGHNPPKTWFANYAPDYVSGFVPSTELYSAKDPNVIKWQLGLMKKAGIDLIISSWWGQNGFEDQVLDKIFKEVMSAADNPYPDMKFTIYYEKEGFANVPKSEIISDINYIKNKYGNSSYFYKIDGRPVIFVYNADGGGINDAQKWKQVRDETGIYVVLKVFTGYKDNLGLADSWHQYAPTTSFGIHGSYSAFISPGYHKGDEAVRLERENFVRFENDVIALKNANVQFKLIETWNEWGEGTGIEPAQKINHNDGGTFTEAAPSYDTKYIDILGKYFNNGNDGNDGNDGNVIIKYALGDADHSESITSADALLYLRFAVGQDISPFHIDSSDDVTCDNGITAADALMILRKAVGQDVSLEC